MPRHRPAPRHRRPSRHRGNPGHQAAGGVAPNGPAMFIAVMPLKEVASIEMAPVTDVPGHSGPDLVIQPRDPAWGAFWVSTVGAELKNIDGTWTAERKEGNLAELTERLRALVASVTGISSSSEETSIT